MAKFAIEIEPVAEDADLRRQLSDALAAVEEWRALAKRHETQTGAWLGEAQAEKHTRETLADDLAKCGEELNTARAENERLRGELVKAAERAQHQRNRADTLGALYEGEVAAKYNALDARDRAIAERDDARDSLAMSRATVDHETAQRAHAERESRTAFEALEKAVAERDEARKPFAGLFSDLAHLRKMEHGLRVQLANVEAERDDARDMLSQANLPTQTLLNDLAHLRKMEHGLRVQLANVEAERDEARKALAGYEWTEGNAAQVAALRARVAELERINERMLSQLDDVARAITAR